MLRIVSLLSALVRKAPWVAIALVLVITGVLGAFAGQVELADDQEGFAPDAPELEASGRITDLFGEESAGSVMQVIIGSEGGDVITPEGRETVALVTAAIENSAVADRFQTQPGRGSSLSFFVPLDGVAGAGPSLQVIVSSDGGDVFTAEGYALTQAVTGAAFQSSIAPKLSLDNPEMPPVLSYLAPISAPPSPTPTVSVMVTSSDGDVVSQGGLQATLGISNALFSSELASVLAVEDPETPPLLSFLMPAEGGVDQGSVPADADTATVKAAYENGLGQLPPELVPVLGQLLSADKTDSPLRASNGLVVLSLAAPLAPDQEAALADLLGTVEVADGFTLTLLPSQYTTTDQVKAGYQANSAFLPVEFAGFLPFLSSNDSDLSVPSGAKGTVVFNLTELPTDEELLAFGEVLESIAVPDGYRVSSPNPNPTEAELKAAYVDAFAFVPAEQSGLITQLVSSSADLETATASHGLMLVFLNTPDSDEQVEFTDELVSMAESLSGLDLPEGYSASPFAFELLFGDDSFNEEIGRIFQLAFLIIIGILMLVYWLKPKGDLKWGRSLRRTLADTSVTLFTIVMAIAWMQGIGVLLSPSYLGLIGHSSSMAQILPILLIGLGVDYAIHLTSRYREEVGVDGVKPAISTSIKTVGVALVLATLTTMVGFLTNLVSPVPALVDFGVLAAVGILVSFLLMVTFVPAVRQLLDSSAERKGVLPAADLATSEDRLLNRVIGKTSVIAEKFAWGAVIAAVILAGVGEFGRQQLDTTFSFTDFIPVDNPLIDTLKTLSDEFGGGFGETTSVLIEGDVSSAAVHNAGVEALVALDETEDVLLFAGQAAASPLALIDSLINPALITFDPGVAAAAAELGVGADLRVPDGADLSSLYAMIQVVDPAGYSGVIHETDGEQDAALWTINTQAGDVRASELRAGLADAFAPVVATGMDVVATSQNIIGDVVVNSLQASQVQSLVITLLAATLILVINFWFESRRPMLGVITIAPVGLVVLLTFGMMALTGIPFGPVTATISALAIGIGVPYTIHITHRFLEDKERLGNTEEAIRSTMLHTGSALAGSALTTMAGFGVLVTSTLVPFQQFGAVTAYAIGFALMVSILILPSFLVLWDRWHKNREEGSEPEHAQEAGVI